MFIKASLLGVGGALLVASSACGGGSGGSTGNGGNGQPKDATELGLSCPKDSRYTYDHDIKPFMAHYCTGCHATSVPQEQRQGAPSDHNFDSEAGILQEAYHVTLQAAAGPHGANTGMPQGDGPTPSLAERKMLGEWLACNADVNTPE